MSIATELNRIISAKNNLKEQLLNKGIQVNNEKLDEYQYFVDAVHSPFPAVTHPYKGDANLDLVRLQYSKDALKESINNKGGDISNELISSYYNKLENITYTPRLTKTQSTIRNNHNRYVDDPRDVWTDGINIYYTHEGHTYNLLEGNEITWVGDNIPEYGKYIWNGNGNIYYSDSNNLKQYILSSPEEWETYTWNVSVDIGNLWEDKDGNIFLSRDDSTTPNLEFSYGGVFVNAEFYDDLGNVLDKISYPAYVGNELYAVTRIKNTNTFYAYKKIDKYTWTKVYDNWGFLFQVRNGFTINGEIYEPEYPNNILVFHESTLRYERVTDGIINYPGIFSNNPQKNIILSAKPSTYGQDRNVSPSDVYDSSYSGSNYYYQYATTNLTKNTDFVEYSTITNTPSGNVNAFWSDGVNVYNSNNSSNGLVFNKSTNTWDSITWNKSIDGNRIWTDGVDIYLDNRTGNVAHYKLNKSTMQWEDHTWNINLDGSNVWTLNGEYYYDYSGVHSKLNKNTMEWESRTDNGSIVNGYNVWTDGKRVFYSNGSGSSNQKELTINSDNTFTWTNKTWNGLSSFHASQFLWTDGTNIYYEYSTTHKILDLATDTWINNTWSNVNPADRNIFSVNPNKNFLCLLKAKTFTQDRNIHPEDIIIYSGSTNYQLQKL